MLSKCKNLDQYFSTLKKLTAQWQYPWELIMERLFMKAHMDNLEFDNLVALRARDSKLELPS